MSRRVQTIIGLMGLLLFSLLVLLLSYDSWIPRPVSIVVFLAASAILAVAFNSNARWPRYALIGVTAGFFIGGIAMGWWAWFVGRDDEFWGDFVAVIGGIAGAFFGSILGAACGGVLGYTKDWLEQHNQDHVQGH